MLNLKFASIAGYILMVLAIVSMAISGSLLASGYILILIQLLAVMLMVWARITFGRRSFHFEATTTQGELVTTGPYAFLRHPIYASLLCFIWAGVLSHLSTTSFCAAVIFSAGIAVRIYSEEHFLSLRYPNYPDYAKRTKRIIPYIY